MITRFALAGSTALSLLVVPSAAAPLPVWEYERSNGSVRVSADRKHITVCDLEADNLYIEAEYATSMLGIHTVADSNGAQWGCGEDRTYISYIDVFKLCTGIRGVTRSCDDAIWIKRR